MEQYQPIELPEEILLAADDITVAELLQSTSAQCWIVSALVNSQRFHEHFAHSDLAEEDKLLFKIYKINRALTRQHKQECYRRVNECSHLGQRIHQERAAYRDRVRGLKK